MLTFDTPLLYAHIYNALSYYYLQFRLGFQVYRVRRIIKSSPKEQKITSMFKSVCLFYLPSATELDL